MTTSRELTTPVATRRFTVDEYRALYEQGVIQPDERTELIRGEIVTPPPIGPQHISTVNRLTHLMVHAVGDSAIVQIQSPLELDKFSLPQPDVCLLQHRDDFFKDRTPEVRDAHLVIEVVYSSERYDRELKLPLYAEHGVGEVWLVLIRDEAVEVHSTPTDDGYEKTHIAQRGDLLAPAGLASVQVTVDDILGPPG